MEREALKSKVLSRLGSTKLTGLTDETFNHQLDFALSFVSDDSQVNDDFLDKVVGSLKNVDGNVHKKVGDETRSLRSQLESFQKPPHVDAPPSTPNDDEEPQWFKAYREQQDDRIKKMEDDRRLEKAEAAKHAAKEQVRKNLLAKFEKAGLEANEELVNITMSGVVIPEQDVDIDALVSSAEESYLERAKKLHIDIDYSQGGQGGNGGGSNDNFFDSFIKERTAGWKEGE